MVIQRTKFEIGMIFGKEAVLFLKEIIRLKFHFIFQDFVRKGSPWYFSLLFVKRNIL